MDIDQIRERFIESSICPDVIIHLGTMFIDEYHCSDVAKDAFYDDFDEVWKAIGIEPPEEMQDEIDVIEEHLRINQKTGFLVQFSTPVPTNFSSSGFTFSWGCSRLKWIYADTYEAACEAAIKWRDEYIEEMREREMAIST